MLDRLIAMNPWKPHFHDFVLPYGFYGIEEYRQWIQLACLKPIRLELIPKDMEQNGKENFTGWVRTTRLPYTQRIPAQMRSAFISEVVESYIKRFPMDTAGHIHIKMNRLEVEGIHP